MGDSGMIEYNLTPEDILKAKAFSEGKAVRGKKGTINDNIIGTLGEIAYGKIINVDANLKLYKRGVGDGGADFPNTQVKTVGYRNRTKKLIVNDSVLDNPKITKIVLMCVVRDDISKAYFVGEISKENFLKKAKRAPRYDNNYTLSEYDLDVRH